MWKNLFKTFQRCSKATNFDKLVMANLVWDKLFVPFRNNRTSDGCVVVLVGVGNEENMEKAFLTNYPTWNCQFFGADPDYQTGKVFEQHGKLLVTGVDAIDGVLNLSIITAVAGYHVEPVKTVSLGHFLRDFVGRRRIHFLSLDAEGSEFRILPYLTSRRYVVESEATVICQLMIEFHDAGCGTRNYRTLLRGFLVDSSFVPLKADGYHILLYNASDCARAMQLTVTT